MKEIVAPIDIADAHGHLNRDAVGWARHPILGCALSRDLSRVARWNYWCLSTRTHALTLLIADVGFAGVVFVSFLDFARPQPIDRAHVVPRGFGAQLPDDPRGDFAYQTWRLALSMRHQGDVLAVEGRARTLLGARLAIALEITRPTAHETVNVLVPWSETQFQLTSKQQGLPVRGTVEVDGRTYAFDAANQAFACLDFGRGRWPRGIEWDWAFAATSAGARTVGWNLGGRWTDGTGVTENGLVIDGRVHKIESAVDFAYDRRAFTVPWRIRTRDDARVDLRFVPWCHRAVKVPLGLVRVEVNQMMGAFSGTVIDDAATPIVLADVVGLAESVRARW